ncbi:MAG: SMI1/KNR4 family protein [Verrucomicrobia bacterium]|nr:SMI1/KNR4 family protein [Verrucomicrobiota bacterium]
MNSHVHRFYRKFADEQAPIRLYHEVIGLHESPRFSWEEMVEKAPSLPKGWYELSRLKPVDRVEFTRDFWLATLPFLPHAHAFIQKFFGQLDDVGVYLTQMRFDSPFECEIVYSLKDGSCFYHGAPPCPDEEIEQLKFEFQNVLPEDFLAFLKIHDGFSKHSDIGIIRTRHLREVRKQLCEELEQTAQEIISSGHPIDPADLIPFYESFGQPSYQCFFAGWTPLSQAGNVYYSSLEKVLSDIRDRNAWQENLAFPTFLDWLIFYLESIE